MKENKTAKYGEKANKELTEKQAEQVTGGGGGAVIELRKGATGTTAKCTPDSTPANLVHEVKPIVKTEETSAVNNVGLMTVTMEAPTEGYDPTAAPIA